jgi:plastocyanin
VRIDGMKFVPDRVEVAVGERITWVNRDFVPHTVTGKGIESGELAEFKTFSYVAKAPGEVPYICRLHPVMKGTIVVR